ncbi:MAG: beta-Ala-His dipeptidase [Candidatus Lokiarchaeota archaeon]|nr:beta-Ala-His dipeptidase [Candidatus Lokiarchaeota archaeon]
MINLKNIGSPKEFWIYFLEICKIPRCSGKEGQIRDFIKKKASNFKFECKSDIGGNLAVKIPSEYYNKNSTKVIFQCHMDMVCEKDKDREHDFLKDPIQLEIITNKRNNWIKGKGTTLGADNGVGIAYCLTLMDRIYNNKINIQHLSIEFLFTVQEESGLSGVFNIKKEFIDGNYLINLDSEEDDRFTIGCAGGINTIGVLDIDFKNINTINLKLKPIKISITGLIGGHSGIDINKKRGNSIKIISKILWKLNNRYGIFLSSILGGNLSNAIPREAEADFFMDENQEEDIISLLEKIKLEIELGIGHKEKNLKIEYRELEDFKNKRIIPKHISNNILNLLYIMPNGVISVHPKNQELIHTSTNLASIKIEGKALRIITSQRSLYDISKENISEKIEALFKSANFNINRHGDYPGWTPNFQSRLLKIAKKSYKELFKEEAIVQSIHAGLETGILKESFPNMDMISLGPLIVGGHSPNERLHIKSVEKIWRLILAILDNFR